MDPTTVHVNSYEQCSIVFASLIPGTWFLPSRYTCRCFILSAASLFRTSRSFRASRDSICCAGLSASPPCLAGPPHRPPASLLPTLLRRNRLSSFSPPSVSSPRQLPPTLTATPPPPHLYPPRPGWFPLTKLSYHLRCETSHLRRERAALIWSAVARGDARSLLLVGRVGDSLRRFMAVTVLQYDPVDPPAIRVWVVVYAEMKYVQGIPELEDETELEAMAAAASDPSTQAAPHTEEPKRGRTCRSASILSSSASTVAQVYRSICHKAL